MKKLVLFFCLAVFLAGCGPVNKVASLVESVRDRSAGGQRVWTQYLNKLCSNNLHFFEVSGKYKVSASCQPSGRLKIMGYVNHAPRFTDSLFVRDAKVKKFNRFLRYLGVHDKDLFVSICEKKYGHWVCQTRHGIDAFNVFDVLK
jgi:uncharacterized protein YceK